MAGDIETERLRLRLIEERDVPDLVALDADPEVMRLINGGRATTVADSEERVSGGRRHVWVAHDLTTAAFVGWFSLRPGGPDERELGYRLGRPWWCRGLATEGSEAMLALAFGQLGASRVWAQTMAVNNASRRVMERCGMRFVRTFVCEWDDVIEGGEHGDVEYELFATDWRDSHPPS